MHWFAIQPYSISESLFSAPTDPIANPWFVASFNLFGEILCLLLVVFPITVAWLPRIRKVGGTFRIALFSILVFWVTFQIVSRWTLPWINNMLVFEFTAAYGDPSSYPSRLACSCPR